MSTERENIIEEANALELEFPSNIPTEKLKGMIAEKKGEPVPIAETPEEGPKTKEVVVDKKTEESSKEVKSSTKNLNKFENKRLKIANAKKSAFATRVVTITNKDNRENDIMTTVYVSFENQYFGLSKVVPLDIPVELEESLIKILAGTAMTLHKDEIVDGKRTGNKIPMRVKKFAISYGKSVKE